MARENLDTFVTYYQRELAYLRRATTEFASAHPKIARRLELGQGETADPHVERLIETFAYLTGRLQRDLDDQYPLISTALLDILYPHLTTLIPPMTIAQMTDKGGVGRANEGILVAKDRILRARADQGAYVEFKNCYDTEVWPLQLTQAELIAADTLDQRLPEARTTRMLRLRLEKTVYNLDQLPLHTLRFYLNGDPALQNLLYQLIFTEESDVWVQPNVDRIRADAPVKRGRIAPVGFAPDQLVLANNRLIHPAYVLLSEFFHFPQKFMFFDVCDISTQGAQQALDLFISVPDRLSVQKTALGRENFKLGCTPVINLFPKVSEPFGRDLRQVEHQLVPDYRQHESMEVHSITRVYTHVPGAAEPEVIAPYFGFDHGALSGGAQKFWYARRKPRKSLGGGSDYYLSFVDYNLQPDAAPTEVVYADILCTNRQLASEMPQNCALIPPLGCEVTAVALHKPTSTVYPKLDGETQWKLISHLGLNHLSLSGDGDRTMVIKELLALYVSLLKDLSPPEVQAICAVQTRWVTRRMGNDGWRGFVQGTEVELRMREVAIDSNSGLLLSAVLNEFFALSCSVNSFIELVLKIEGREGIWKKWQPNSGARFLL